VVLNALALNVNTLDPLRYYGTEQSFNGHEKEMAQIAYPGVHVRGAFGAFEAKECIS